MRNDTHDERSEVSVNLSELIKVRQLLREDVRPHKSTLAAFRRPVGFGHVSPDTDDVNSDAIHVDDSGYNAAGSASVDTPNAAKSVDILPIEISLTTSMTCFESLDGSAEDYRGPIFGDSATDEHFTQFVRTVIELPEEWNSEGDARRYCLVRAGAPMARLLRVRDRGGASLIPDETQDRGSKFLKQRFRGLWKEAIKPLPGSEALFEVSRHSRSTRSIGDLAWDAAIDPYMGSDLSNVNQSLSGILPGRIYNYPPNAFLTYWGLIGLEALELRSEFSEQIHISSLWVRSVLGREIALQKIDSPERDPQQIVWAIASLLAASDQWFSTWSFSDSQLVKAALSCFFEQQRDDGDWERGAPLFHYPAAGDAYCYTFETLAELLFLANRDEGFSEALRPHIDHLLRARKCLLADRRPIPSSDLLFGWASGHQARRLRPEGWATAAAFRFLQELRRFVAREAGLQAEAILGATTSLDGLSKLRDRGRTFARENDKNAFQALSDLFLPSIEADPTSPARPAARTRFLGSRSYDRHPDRPDRPPRAARSAILFGPPGTGKTTLARCVAGARREKYVEISAAQFLDQGMDSVSRRADEIFELVEQLNGGIVLFDEIDEIVQKRDSQADAVSRFFTTTMLPRLAHLWEANRVIFFLNTNRMQNVDPAVARSQRFDAAILVMPPSIQKKLAALTEEVRALISEDEVERALRAVQRKSRTVQHQPAWFPFLRWDQVFELNNAAPLNREELLSRLDDMGERLLRTDWALVVDALDPQTEPLVAILDAWEKELAFQRRR